MAAAHQRALCRSRCTSRGTLAPGRERDGPVARPGPPASSTGSAVRVAPRQRGRLPAHRDGSTGGSGWVRPRSLAGRSTPTLATYSGAVGLFFTGFALFFPGAGDVALPFDLGLLHAGAISAGGVVFPVVVLAGLVGGQQRDVRARRLRHPRGGARRPSSRPSPETDTSPTRTERDRRSQPALSAAQITDVARSAVEERRDSPVIVR